MRVGQRVIANRFEMGPLLGEGAIGAVHLGRDTQTGGEVAIKVLRTEVLVDQPELVERFHREGEVLRKLDHPNIVRVLAVVEEEGQPYIVMEYVPGGSLADLLRRQHQLPVEQIVAIALELADALSRTHHLNIVHRDIKPGNVLLAEDGTPRLTDFGLAHLGSYPAMTATGARLGTFQYLSPEACDYQTLDERTDIWSLGIVMFEMLAGERPFDGSSPYEITRAILNQPLPSLAAYRSDVPPALADLISRMLTRSRQGRIASARLVGAELEAIQRSMQPSPRPAELPVVPAASRSAPAPGPPEAARRIRTLIVDDHAVVRQGLRTFLELQDDMEVVGEAANGLEAVELAGRLQPDIVLLDLVMPQMDGIEATRRIAACSPKSRVVILTSFGDEAKVLPAIRAGAQGYLLKDIPPEQLVQAVREAQQGRAQLHPDVAAKLMSAVAGREEAPAPAGEELTERELEVVRLIAQGCSNREIAEALTISEKTVKTHVSNILGKLHLQDRTQVAIYALQKGLAEKT
jgi:NarL family two-component system response regulator LiaR